ncbi:hypothetical protein V493_01110 [Pseudogymnoascus sp. VKM F-4281 (FW-2241)]|nr:hypothetical protein V493_01110 [Pseudogymnoascus sp. VKM F-4281 (FW-2241)]
MESRQDIATKYLDAEATKLIDLAKAILDQDGFLDDDYMASQYRYSKESILVATYRILLSTPSLVIQAIIQGTLPTISASREVQYLQSPQYTAVPPDHNYIFPTIYAIYLVDQETNDPPTIEDLHVIIDSTPLAGGIVDIGFSGDGAARIDQHLQGENSNRIMQYFYNAATREFGDVYELQGYIVGKMRLLEHCALAEIIFTRLAQSYISRGGGFNGTTAGASIKGAHLLSAVAWEEIGGVKLDRATTEHFESDTVKMRAVIQEHNDRTERAKAVVVGQAIYSRIREMLTPDEKEKLDAKKKESRDAAYSSQLRAGDGAAGLEEADEDGNGTVDDDDDDDDNITLPPMRDVVDETEDNPISDSSDPVVLTIRRRR